MFYRFGFPMFLRSSESEINEIKHWTANPPLKIHGNGKKERGDRYANGQLGKPSRTGDAHAPKRALGIGRVFPLKLKFKAARARPSNARNVWHVRFAPRQCGNTKSIVTWYESLSSTNKRIIDNIVCVILLPLRVENNFMFNQFSQMRTLTGNSKNRLVFLK